MKYFCRIFPLKEDTGLQSCLNFRGVIDTTELSQHIINSLLKKTVCKAFCPPFFSSVGFRKDHISEIKPFHSSFPICLGNKIMEMNFLKGFRRRL
jgi:hypothetical protein